MAQASLNGLGSLSSACHNIPFRPRKRAKTNRNKPSPFPVLKSAEGDAGPSTLRYKAYLDSTRTLDSLFERCIQKIYAPLFSDLRAFLRSAPGDGDPSHGEVGLFIPGFDDGWSDTPVAIRTAFLISASTPSFSSLSQRLVSSISTTASDSDTSSIITVTLDRAECQSAGAAIRLLVARFISQGAAQEQERETAAENEQIALLEESAGKGRLEADLSVLQDWYLRKFVRDEGSDVKSSPQPKLVLHLPSLEAMEPTVLSDMLLSLQAFSTSLCDSARRSSDRLGSALILILGISSPAGAAPGAGRRGATATAAAAPAPWSTYIPRSVLQGLDFTRFALPNKEGVWMELVENFLTSPDLPILIGRRTFEYIRQAYWEKNADLDSVLDAMRLAAFDHFSSNPLSAFMALKTSTVERVKPAHWRPQLLAELRVAILGGDNDHGLWFPKPCSHQDDQVGPRTSVQRLLSNDAYLLKQIVELKVHRNVLAHRQQAMIKFLAHGFQCLHKLDSAGSALRAALATDGFMQQREAEMTSSMLTLVVAQCLQASVGSVHASDQKLPAVLSLSNGLTKLCTAARRLQIRDFETFLDELVLFTEVEVAVLGTGGDDTEDMSIESVEATSHSLILDEMESFLAAMRTFQQRLAQLISAAGGDLVGRSFDQLYGESTISEAADGDISPDDPERQTKLEQRLREKEQRQQERIQRVQRRLEAEERSVTLKREVTDWIATQVRAFLDWSSFTEGQSGRQSPLGLIKRIWWHDDFDSIAALLDASPRSGLLQPLADPQTFLNLLEGRAGAADEMILADGEVPDLCRAYSLYRESGKNVNLADWFEAFRQGLIQAASSAKSSADALDEKTEAHAAVSVNMDEVGAVTRAENGTERVDSTPSGRRSRRQAAQINGHAKRGYAESGEAAGSDDDDDDDFDAILDTPSKRRAARTPRSQQMRQRAALQRGALDAIGSGLSSGRADPAAAGAQARFALAINELARMGLLRSARRKSEHVTKAVWDLVVE